MKYRVTLEDQVRDVDVERTDSGWRVRLDGGDWRELTGDLRQGELALDGRRLGTHVQGSRVDLQLDGTALVAEVVDPRKARADLGSGAGEGQIRSPMPGVVVRIPVQPGQEVTAGQVVVVVEAMKMENEFKAPTDGVVEAIPVEVGQAIEASALLATITPS